MWPKRWRISFGGVGSDNGTHRDWVLRTLTTLFQRDPEGEGEIAGYRAAVNSS